MFFYSVCLDKLECGRSVIFFVSFDYFIRLVLEIRFVKLDLKFEFFRELEDKVFMWVVVRCEESVLESGKVLVYGGIELAVRVGCVVIGSEFF